MTTQSTTSINSPTTNPTTNPATGDEEGCKINISTILQSMSRPELKARLFYMVIEEECLVLDVFEIDFSLSHHSANLLLQGGFRLHINDLGYASLHIEASSEVPPHWGPSELNDFLYAMARSEELCDEIWPQLHPDNN